MEGILSLVSEHDDLFPSSSPLLTSSQRRRTSQAAHDFFSPASKRRKSTRPSPNPPLHSHARLAQSTAASPPAARPTLLPPPANPPPPPGIRAPPSLRLALLSFTRPYSIVSVTMRNFMCYTNHTVRLGPHLNMVLGPNGAGKSTVVCAICLGLGGDERSLGRMPSVSGYIRRQQAQAEIEVELYEGMRAKGGAGNLTIRRTITQDDKSVYHELAPTAAGAR